MLAPTAFLACTAHLGASSDGSNLFTMLTVVALLSGPHRLEMLDAALSSIPIDSQHVSAVHITHPAGPWDWGGELRERFEAHPKVRIIEFPGRVDFAASFTRTLDTVQTPWGLMLPDDDLLLPSNLTATLQATAARPDATDYGFVAGGWYYLKDGRYLASYVKRRGLWAALHYAPKFCTTLLNMQRVREVGGFDGSVGGFCDTALFARLSFEYDALITRTPIGIYREHAGQESARLERAYGPFVQPLVALLGRYARTPAEREEFEQALAAYVKGRARPLATFVQKLLFPMRSQAEPKDAQALVQMHNWSSV